MFFDQSARALRVIDSETVLVALLTDDDNASGFDRTIFNETFRKPFDTGLLAERVRTLISRKKQLA